LKEKLKLLNDEINSIKTDLKLALQQTHAQMKSSSIWQCLSNTCVNSNTLNMQLEWYPSSCDDIIYYYGSVDNDQMPEGYYLIQQNASETLRKYIKCTQ